MLLLLFYSMICETLTFKDKDILTEQDVRKAMNEKITNVSIINIKIIENSAFFSCTKLKSVSIGSSVNSIGTEAFHDCFELENVSFEKESKLTTIGDNAFSNCKKLQLISIPSSVNSIGMYAFCVCKKLENVSFEKGSKLTTIWDYAFYYCVNLKNIPFEELSNLTTIKFSSFQYCGNLISIKLPSQLKEISNYSFGECSKLEAITILSNISEIKDYAFLNCSNLKCIQYFGTKEPNIGHNAFQGCKVLEYVNTNSMYSSETFGNFKVQKTLKLSDLHSPKRSRLKNKEIACIVIFGFIFIVIICIILYFTVFKSLMMSKHSTQ